MYVIRMGAKIEGHKELTTFVHSKLYKGRAAVLVLIYTRSNVIRSKKLKNSA